MNFKLNRNFDFNHSEESKIASFTTTNEAQFQTKFFQQDNQALNYNENSLLMSQSKGS
jgi:hypothetical protein